MKIFDIRLDHLQMILSLERIHKKKHMSSRSNFNPPGEVTLQVGLAVKSAVFPARFCSITPYVNSQPHCFHSPRSIAEGVPLCNVTFDTKTRQKSIACDCVRNADVVVRKLFLYSRMYRFRAGFA